MLQCVFLMWTSLNKFKFLRKMQRRHQIVSVQIHQVCHKAQLQTAWRHLCRCWRKTWGNLCTMWKKTAYLRTQMSWTKLQKWDFYCEKYTYSTNIEITFCKINHVKSLLEPTESQMCKTRSRCKRRHNKLRFKSEQKFANYFC